jgi:hypothetical protein
VPPPLLFVLNHRRQIGSVTYRYTALTTGIAVRADPVPVGALFWTALKAVGENATGDSRRGTDVSAAETADDVEGESAETTAFVFTQQLGSAKYRLEGDANGTFSGSLDGKRLFGWTGNVRIVTNTAGVVTAVVGVSAATETASLSLPPFGSGGGVRLTVAPNEEWSIQEGKAPVLVRKVPFQMPF